MHVQHGRLMMVMKGRNKEIMFMSESVSTVLERHHLYHQNPTGLNPPCTSSPVNRPCVCVGVCIWRGGGINDPWSGSGALSYEMILICLSPALIVVPSLSSRNYSVEPRRGDNSHMTSSTADVERSIISQRIQCSGMVFWVTPFSSCRVLHRLKMLNV